jgi:hypothetical protein
VAYRCALFKALHLFYSICLAQCFISRLVLFFLKEFYSTDPAQPPFYYTLAIPRLPSVAGLGFQLREYKNLSDTVRQDSSGHGDKS